MVVNDVMCDVCDLERKVLFGCTLAVHAVHAKIKNFVEAVELIIKTVEVHVAAARM